MRIETTGRLITAVLAGLSALSLAALGLLAYALSSAPTPALWWLGAILVLLACASAIAAYSAQSTLQSARLAARSSSQQMRAMSDALPMAVYQLRIGPGDQRQFTFMSKRVQDILGVAAEEILADPPARWRHVHPEDLPRLAAYMARTRDTGRQHDLTAQSEFEFRVVHGGATRWVRAASRAIPTGVGSATTLWSGFYEDITERKALQGLEAARLAAEASREEFIAMSQALPVAIFKAESAEGQLRFSFLSARTEAILGVPAQEIMQDSAVRWRHVHPEDLARLQQELSTAFSATRPGGKLTAFETETRLLRDGSVRWLRIHSLPLRTRSDGAVLWSGFYEDITERKAAQAQLESARLRAEAAQEEFIAMSQSLPMAIYQVTIKDGKQQRFAFVSQRTQDILGVPAQDILDDPASRWRNVHPEDLPKILERLARRAESGDRPEIAVSREFEFRVMRDGATHWVRAMSRRIRIEPDGSAQWSGFYEDITERKASQAMLEAAGQAAAAAQQEFIAMSQTLPMAIYKMENTAAGEQRFTFVSSRAESILGVKAQEIMDYAPNRWRHVHPDDLLQLKQTVANAVELARVEGRLPAFEAETRLLRDGQERWVRMASLPIRTLPDGGSLWSGYYEDITERHQNLAALMHAKELAEQAAQAKSDFLANMSHEIRTPLNAVIGMSHLLRNTALTAQQQSYLQRIQESGRHLLGVINDILDFSKIDAGKFAIEKTEFSLAALLDRVTGMVAEKAGLKQLALVVDVAADVPARIEGDELRLGQVLTNYANNAVKFTERGQVTISVSVQERTGDEVLLRFEVADTGIGLSPEQIGGLFQSFAQADASTTRKYGGTGLGLVISKKLANLMGGDVGVQSALGEGSRFWFTARARASSDTAASGWSAEATGREYWTVEEASDASLVDAQVLLVEDNEINTEVATALLAEAGCIVDTATNGQLAVDQVQRKRYDVVLMDMQMPVMDGITATRLIRALPGLQALPIIAMTANVMRQDRERCMAAGMDDFLGKPIDPAQLWQILKKWYRPQSHSGFGELASATAAAKTTKPATAGQPFAPWPETIDGLDMQLGRSRVLGNEGLYRSMLQRFALSHADSPQKIAQAIESQDLELACRIAHTVKGIAGTIGAVRLQLAGHALEQALQPPASKAQWHAPWLSYKEALEALLQALAPALAAGRSQSPESVDAQTGSAAKATEVLARLRQLLQDDDPDAASWADAHAAVLKQTLDATQYAEFHGSLQAFDLDRALETLLRATASP